MRKYKVAPPEVSLEVDDALGLQAISIRLDKELVKKFKLIAQIKGVIYQPLMREALGKYADAEMLNILSNVARNKIRRKASTPAKSVDATTIIQAMQTGSGE